MIDTNTFATLTDNGSTAAFVMPGDVNDVDVYIQDGPTYDSASITAETSTDGGTTWVTQAALSAITSGDGYIASFRAYGQQLRFTAASVAAASADIDITVKATAVSSSVERYVITANGNTDIPVTRPGPVYVAITGTWDSASVTLSVSPDGTLYVDTGVTAITADGAGLFANAAGDSLLRLVTASAAGVITVLDVEVYSTNV